MYDIEQLEIAIDEYNHHNDQLLEELQWLNQLFEQYIQKLELMKKEYEENPQLQDLSEDEEHELWDILEQIHSTRNQFLGYQEELVEKMLRYCTYQREYAEALFNECYEINEYEEELKAENQTVTLEHPNVTLAAESAIAADNMASIDIETPKEEQDNLNDSKNHEDEQEKQAASDEEEKEYTEEDEESEEDAEPEELEEETGEIEETEEDSEEEIEDSEDSEEELDEVEESEEIGEEDELSEESVDPQESEASEIDSEETNESLEESDKEKVDSAKEDTSESDKNQKDKTSNTEKTESDKKTDNKPASETKAATNQDKKKLDSKDKSAAAPGKADGKGLSGQGLAGKVGTPKGKGASPTKKATAAIPGKKPPVKKGGLKGGLKGKAANVLGNRVRKKAIEKGEDPDSLKNKAKAALLRRIAILLALNPMTWIIFFGLIALLIVVTMFSSCLGMLGLSMDATSEAQTVEQIKTIYYPVTEDEEDEEEDEEESGAFDGEWVLFNQNSPSDWNSKIHPATDGWGYACGVVCGGMVLATYGGGADKYDPDFCCTELCGGSASFNHGALANYLNEHQDIFHLEASDYWEDFTNLKSEIQDACNTGGGAIIYCHTCNGHYQNEHWIIITAMNNGNCTIADPAVDTMYDISWDDLAHNGALGSTMIFKYNGPSRTEMSKTKGQGSYSNTLMIGDSIMVNTGEVCKEYMPGINIDADSSRSLENGGVQSPGSDEGVLDHVRALNPKQYSRYVIGTGNNDAGGMDMEAGEEIVSCLKGKQIWFVTEFVSNNSEGTRTTNDTINKLCRKYRNVHKVDWYSVVSKHQSEYLGGDNCHPQNREAQEAYASILKAALDRRR